MTHRKPRSLASQVYDFLRAAIIRGDLAPGEKIVELAVAEQMGTSQGPVREALQRLQGEGLVERRARRATYVTEVSLAEMYEIFVIRSVIEGFAAFHAAQTLSEAQVGELQALIDRMVAVGRAGDMAALVELDLTFHRRILDWAARPILLNAWLPLYAQVQRFVVQTHHDYFADLVELASTHQPIVDALRAGDPGAVTAVMQAHVMLIWQRIDPAQAAAYPAAYPAAALGLAPDRR